MQKLNTSGPLMNGLKFVSNFKKTEVKNARIFKRVFACFYLNTFAASYLNTQGLNNS